MRSKYARQSTRKTSYVGIGAAILFGFALLVVVLLTTRQDGFVEAVNNPDLRLSYVARMLHARPLPPNVQYAEYIHTEEEYQSIIRNTTLNLLLDDIVLAFSMAIVTTTRSETILFIFPDSFSGGNIKTEKDWIAALEHEYYHADQLVKGGIETETLGFLSFAPIFRRHDNRALQRDIMEMDALRQDFARANISESFRQNQQKMYSHFYLKLWADGDISNELRSDLKVDFFPFFLGNRDAFNPDSKIHLLDPKQQRYDFTPEETKRIIAWAGKHES